MGRPLASLALLVVVVLAGCAFGPTSPDAQPSTTKQTPVTTTPEPPVPLDAAKNRALAAEEARVDRLLANASNVSGGAPGGTSTPEATVVNVTGNTVVVEVWMSYGYEYACPSDGGGAVDGSTYAVYRVTENETTLVEVREPVDPLCN